jgi:hypothetical protein
MKVVSILVGLLMMVGVAVAGEKEELQLKQTNLMLTLQVMQYQFKDAQDQLKDVNTKLEALQKAEKPVPPKEKEKK